MTPDPGDVTRLLQRVDARDEGAADELWSVVYDQLAVLARRAMADERGAHTLQATALVHEAWIKLVPAGGAASFEGQAHFFRTAARAMRRILVDHARGRGRAKRGGGKQRLELEDELSTPASDASQLDLLALDEALEKLSAMDEDLGRLVELRFFAGQSIADTATLLGRSTATVERSWRVARAFLRRQMDAGDGP